MDPKKVRTEPALSYNQGDFKDSVKLPWGRKWSPVTDSAGVGPTPDGIYGNERPRTFDIQKELFELNNPEFSEGAAAGDWTSWKFDPKV